MKPLKIALTGPSGSGKTTIAKFISEKFEIPFIPGSASLIMNPHTREKLYMDYGYEAQGHQNVINLSSKNPEFGRAFQKTLLEDRIENLRAKETFVTDRCPIDNLAYYMSQTVHNDTRENTKIFVDIALEALGNKDFTHIIYIPSLNPGGEIEDNSSRIINPYFQKKMNAIFDWVIRDYFVGQVKNYSPNLSPRFLPINFWDLTQRKEAISSFIS